MSNYFNTIEAKVMSKGVKVSENKWKLESCIYEVVKGVCGLEERIFVPGLVHAYREPDSGSHEVVILEGSEDSLKFLATSI